MTTRNRDGLRWVTIFVLGFATSLLLDALFGPPFWTRLLIVLGVVIAASFAFPVANAAWNRRQDARAG